MKKYNLKSGLLFAAHLALVAVFAVIVLGLFSTPTNATGEWYIRDDATGGDCSTIGVWDDTIKTCVINQDLSVGIIIESNGVVLDGANHSMVGQGSDSGILISTKQGIIIKNIFIRNFLYGIRSKSSQNVVIEGNTISSNSYGISISHGNNHTLNNNTVSNNQYGGIGIGFSNGSILRNNIVVRNAQFSQYNLHGIQISNSNGNTLSDNVISNNGYGLQLFSVENTTMTANEIYDNIYNFLLSGTQDSHFSGNIIDDTNTVDSKPIYYVKNAIGDVYDDSANIGTFYCINCRDVTVKNLTLSKNRTGIFFWNTTGSKVENINVATNEYGIWFQSSHSNMVTGNYGMLGLWQSRTNTIKNHSGEIDLRDASNGNNILNNNAGGTIHAIYIEASHNNIIMGNTAVASWGASIELLYANNNILRENKIGYGSYYGIYLHGSYNNLLENNTINQYSLRGIIIAFSKYNIIKGNTISNHVGQYGGRGLYLSNAAQYNKIYNNNFVNNPVPVSFGRDSTNNVFHLDLPIGGNYWDSFDEPSEGCYDNNADGLCDAPYILSGGQDNLPWTKKDGWLAPPNSPPTLSFPETGPYAGDGVDPNKGTHNSTPFYFEVEYKDEDGDAPKNVTLHTITEENIQEAYIMERTSGENNPNFENGELYSATIGYLPNGVYHYYFTADDGRGNQTRKPENDELTFESGLFVTPAKDIGIIRAQRSFHSTLLGTAGQNDVIELLPLCSVQQDECNDEILVYMPVTEINSEGDPETHYWLKVKWNELIGYVADDLVMTIIPENQDARIMRLVEEIRADNRFSDLDSFPRELFLGLISAESDGTLNNEVTSVDSPFGGIKQVHPSLSGGWNRNCKGDSDGNRNCKRATNSYDWTNLDPTLQITDTLLAPITAHDDEVRMLKNYIGTQYNNTNEGLRKNIEDGFQVLKSKFGQVLYTCAVGTGTTRVIDSIVGEIDFNCADKEIVKTMWYYNGFVDPTNYLRGISDNMNPVLLKQYYESDFVDHADLRKKMIVAQRHYDLVKWFSPILLQVYDSQNNIVGEFTEGVQNTMENALYDSNTKSIAILFPEGETYRYVAVGNAKGTYGVSITFSRNDVFTTFTATDIPTTPNTVHEYTVNEEALARGNIDVTIKIDIDNDGVFEKTVTTDNDLTYDEFILQTETTMDFDPDTLNLKSKGKVVTVYIELPEGYDISQIDISSILLNDLVPALIKPTEIGDYDGDGIPDLMIKFDRSEVQAILSPGEEINLTLTGKVFHDESYIDFKGSNLIRVINNGKW